MSDSVFQGDASRITEVLKSHPNPALLLFTLGPVQDFIAAARRTSDLREGSYMLSCITSTALKAVVDEIPGGKDAVLFPNLNSEPELLARWRDFPQESNRGIRLPEDLALPNRFLVIVPYDKVKTLAEKAEKAARATLREAVEAAKGAFGPAYGWHEADHFLETAWGALPYSPKEDTYREVYIQLEQAVGGTKAIRAFSQVPSSGFRDSLSPSQGALIPSDHAGQLETEKFWRRKEVRTRLRLREGEQLSAITLTKRLFQEHSGKSKASQFPSTASFAVADFKRDVLKHLENVALQQAVDDFLLCVQEVAQSTRGDVSAKESGMPMLVNLAKSLPQHLKNTANPWACLPGDWLFKEFLTNESMARQTENMPSFGVLHRAEVALRTLTSKAKSLGIAPPSRYYAVIQYDGDHMGRWLSGEKTWSGMRQLSPEAHQEVSARLGTFAHDLVRHLVHEQYLGQLVYSGGDDVLAFVSFRDALPLLEALRAAFSGHLEWRDGKYYVDFARSSDTVTLPNGASAHVLGPNATASADLVLAHHQDALTEVMEGVRKTEKKAKNAGRNRFALQVGRRSGDYVKAAAPWHNATVRTLQALQAIEEAFRNGYLSSSFIYDARESARILPDEAVEAELRRLFNRRTEGIKGEERDVLWHHVMTLNAALEAHPDEKSKEPRLSHLLDLLQAALVLGKGGDRSL